MAPENISGEPRWDDGSFDRIYDSLPLGLVIAAAPLDSFETLRAFCYSLKGTAIRRGSNAMFVVWERPQEEWRIEGTGYVRRFIRKHHPRGVRLFLINSNPMEAWANEAIIVAIREVALAEEVTVLVTAIAENIATELLAADGRLKGRAPSPSKLYDSLNLKITLGKWRGILLKQDRVSDDWYSAKVAVGTEEPPDHLKIYGPLNFVDKCPQPPAAPHEPDASVPPRRGFIGSLLRWLGLESGT